MRFRRPAGMLPLAEPARGGTIETLRSFLNVQSEQDLLLVVAWGLAALRQRGPYPILVLSGARRSYPERQSPTPVCPSILDELAVEHDYDETRSLFYELKAAYYPAMAVTGLSIEALIAFANDNLCRGDLGQSWDS